MPMPSQSCGRWKAAEGSDARQQEKQKKPSQPEQAVLFRLTARGKACILPRVMENQTTNIDLSALDTEAMRSRLSELGSYL